MGLCLTIAAQMVLERLMVTTTPSLRHRVFWLQNTGKVAQGSHQLFIHLDERGQHLVTKRVACTEGQLVTVHHQTVLSCDGEPIALLRKGDRPAASFNGQIPQGYCFVLGDHPDSVDSRRFGLVDRQQIVQQAYPLW